MDIDRKGGLLMKYNRFLRLLTINIFILFQIVISIGCTPPQFRGSNNLQNIQICSNVLFVVSSMYGDSETIEKDSYGRELFKYSTYESLGYTYGEMCIYAISQKRTFKDIFYYEDYCFIISDSFDNFKQEDIEDLKAKNDWNKPFDQNKCSSRSKRIPSDEFQYIESTNSIEKTITKYCNENDELFYNVGIDKDKDGNILMIFQTKMKGAEGENISKGLRNYMIILTSRGLPRGKECFAEIEDLYNYQEQLHELKIANDWNFS